MLIWIALSGCSFFSAEEPTEPVPAEEPDAEPSKGKKGKKGKGKKGKKGKGKKGKPDTPACPKEVRVNPSWEGEYPDPIADVTAAVEMQGRIDPCQRRASTPCTVPAGLYHPWSDVDADYVTVRAVDRYKVLVDTKIGEIEVAKGAEVAVVRYLAEGFCIFDVSGDEVEAMCPGVADDGKTFEELPGPAFTTLQLIEASCDGSVKAWIDVADLMKQDGVRPGKVLEYGKVGPGE